MSSPTPGMMPMMVPTMPDRMMVFQYIVMSLSLGQIRSIFVLTVSITGCRMTAMISANPKAPTMAGISWMPPEISTLPKLNRGYDHRPSIPTIAISRPMKPAIQPLMGSFGAVRLPQMMMPKIANQNISKLLKSSACLPSHGVKNAMTIMPMTDPRNDPVVAMPIARPARPCLASG